MELFKLFGRIAIDNAEANKKIRDTADEASEAKSKMTVAFEKIGSASVKIGKTIAVGLAAGATAIGALAKQSLDSYADYEQLVGGVDTLFKRQSFEEFAAASKDTGLSIAQLRKEYDNLDQSADVVMKNAANAYKTAGLSANEYMETVTSFSASLLQSLGGDTMEACAYADMAVTDMADNANKMGTSMESIQNAYQGFAKQNYTMLDNLKLGYGGTQEEMYRLLCDAKEIDETFDAVFSLDAKGHLEAGYADIVKAINIVQNEMGITGTTAKEASSTIQGSLAATKAAWKNLLVGFADGQQDLNLLIGNLMDSAITAANNIIPRVTQILSGISNALPQIMTVISTELPVMIEALLPGLVNGAVALAVGLAQMLPSLVEMIFVDLPYLLSNALYESTNPVISSVGSIFLDIGEHWREVLIPAISGIGEALGRLGSAVKPVLAVFPQLFAETTGVANGFDIFRKVSFLVEDALNLVANKISGVATWISSHSKEIQDVVTGCWKAVQNVWENFGAPVWDVVQSCVFSVSEAFGQKMPEIKEFVSQCFSDIESFWENNLKPCFDAIGNFIKNVLAPIFKEVFNNFIGPAVDTAFQHIKDMWENTLKPVFTGITDFLTGVFTLNFVQAFKGIVKVSSGIMSGLVNVVKTPINLVIDLVNSFIGGLNKLQVPDWVPLVGGKGINIPLIPKLEEGGILERGQVGFLEGNGAEAVVPLHQNKEWITAVARDMDNALGGDNKALNQIVKLLQLLIDMLPETMTEAFKSMKFDINNREFARLVKAVNG